MVSFALLFCPGVINRSISTFGGDGKVIIIDAGHGYPDGGAVAKDGTVESEINFSIAKKLSAKLENLGFKCIMTRNDENGIYSDEGTIHTKKVSDIRNRVKLAKSNESALIISIHLNTYPDASVRGAQAFYKSGSEISESIAKEIQNSINVKFQPDFPRNIKKISSNIYLFNHIDNDAILIECGFLTNPRDLENLKSGQFQEKLTDTIAEVIAYKYLKE